MKTTNRNDNENYLKEHLIVNWSNNLFIATLPCLSGCCNENIEIEDLITSNNQVKNYKGEFANMVYKQHKDLDFENFIPLFDALQDTIIQYRNKKTPKN